MRRQVLAHLAVLAVALAAAHPACAQPPKQPKQSTAAASSLENRVDFHKAIRRLYDLKEKAWAAGDAESIVTQFYSADAISVGEGDPNTLVGREDFRKAYRQYVEDVPKIRIESVRSYVNGNAGWDWANFYSEPKPEKRSMYPPSPIRILFTFAKEHGQWVCKGDIFANGKFPPLPPTPP